MGNRSGAVLFDFVDMGLLSGALFYLWRGGGGQKKQQNYLENIIVL